MNVDRGIRWLGPTGLALALALTSPALGGTVSVPSSYFGPSATVDTFEGIAGVSLPLNSTYTVPSSPIPDGWMMPSSHATVTTPSGSNSVFDFNAAGFVNPDPNFFIFGYSLGPDGGQMYGDPSWAAGGIDGLTTTLPSGSAFLALDAHAAHITFPTPVEAVGSTFEAAMYFDVGENGDLTFIAYDTGGNEIGQVTVFGDGVLNDFAVNSWIGIATDDGTASIASIDVLGPLDSNGLRNPAVLDDFRVLVPTPGTLLAFGLCGAPLVRRRRA
jgi:hypothetical protein